VVILGFAVAASGVLLLALISQLTFSVDDWEVLLHRRGFNADVFLTDHAGHPAMALVAAYKAIQATFGMDSIVPYAIASTAAFLTSVIVLFAWLRRRVGDWLALAGALPILFLGGGYEDLLTPFQIGYFAPMAAGIGALLALERGERRGDWLCCGLLVLALTFQSLGLVFVAAAAVAIGWDRQVRARWWVVAIPAALYVLWYLGYGGSTANQFSFENVATSPGFVLDGYASSLASLLGLVKTESGALVGSLDWGRGLLTLALIAVGVRLVRGRPLSKWFWAVIAAGVVFWFLTAINASLGRSPISGRYQYVGAVLIVMAAAELARGWRPSRGATAAVVVASALIAATGIGVLHGAYGFYKGVGQIVRGNLFGLEVAAPNVDPGFVLTPKNSGSEYFTLVDAGPYLSAAEAFGSPAYTEEELLAAAEGPRAGADRVIAAADGVVLRPLAGTPSGCGEAAPVAELRPGTTAIVRNPGDASVDVGLRRYATESFPVELGELEAGEAASLALPADNSPEPWELGAGGGALEVCGS
jgi:hypothetical protein